MVGGAGLLIFVFVKWLARKAWVDNRSPHPSSLRSQALSRGERD